MTEFVDATSIVVVIWCGIRVAPCIRNQNTPRCSCSDTGSTTINHYNSQPDESDKKRSSGHTESNDGTAKGIVVEC